jgi:hypothetical protein
LSKLVHKFYYFKNIPNLWATRKNLASLLHHLATEGPPAGVAGAGRGLPVGNFGLFRKGLQAPPLFIGLTPKVMAVDDVVKSLWKKF